MRLFIQPNEPGDPIPPLSPMEVADILLFEQQIIELDHFAGHLERVAAQWDEVAQGALRHGKRARNAETRRDEALAKAADCHGWIRRERAERAGLLDVR